MNDKTSVNHVCGAHQMIGLFNIVVACLSNTNVDGIENINPSDTSRVIDNYAQTASGQCASEVGDVHRLGQFFFSFLAESCVRVERSCFCAVETN